MKQVARIIAAITLAATLALAQTKTGGGGGAGGEGTGTVTHTVGALNQFAVMVGNGAADSMVLGSVGTTTTVLHGNAAGVPLWGAVTSADTTGTFPTTAHNILSASHDAHASVAIRGDIIVARTAFPAWERLPKGNQYLPLTMGADEPDWTALALDQTTATSGLLPSSRGGTGNGFTKFTGPTTAEKTFTLPDANSTIATGTGTTNSLPKFTTGASGIVGNSLFDDDGALGRYTGANGFQVPGTSGLLNLTCSATTPIGAGDIRCVTGAPPTFQFFGAAAQTLLSKPLNLYGSAPAALLVTKAAGADPTTDNCVKWLAGGGVGDAGAACGAGGGGKSVHAASWFFPGTPATGVQNLRLTLPDGAITNIAILDMRVTVNTVSASSSTFNIQRCVVTSVACSATQSTWVDIYSTVLTLAASNYTVAKGSAPNQNVGSLVPGDQFRASLVTIGASLSDVTVEMTYKYDTQP